MKGNTRPRMQAFRRASRELGATMVEYALALAFLAAAFIAGAQVVGDAIGATFTQHQQSVLEEMSNGDG